MPANPVAAALDRAVGNVKLDEIKGFGRLIAKQLADRGQAAKAAGQDTEIVVLSDFEFGALIYFIAAEQSPMFTGQLWVNPDGSMGGTETKAADPWQYARVAGAIGEMQYGPLTVVGESRIIQAIRLMVAEEQVGEKVLGAPDPTISAEIKSRIARALEN